MDSAVSVELFVEILNRYVYYFDQENDAVSPSNSRLNILFVHVLQLLTAHSLSEQVTTKYLNGLIELIHSNLQSTDAPNSLDNPRRHFQRTLDYIASREFEGVVTNPPIA